MQVRLELVQLPESVDRIFADALGASQAATTPVGHPLGFGLHRGRDDGVPARLILTRFTAPPGRHLPDALNAFHASPLPPKFDGGPVHLELRGKFLVGLALAGTQENPATQDDLLGCGVGGDPACETNLVGKG